MENIVEVRDDKSLQTDVLKELIFSEIFGNFWKILSGCEMTNLFRQVLVGLILFSEIFGNFWKILLECETMNLLRQVLLGLIFVFGNFRKLLENIVGVRDDAEYLQTGS